MTPTEEILLGLAQTLSEAADRRHAFAVLGFRAACAWICAARTLLAAASDSLDEIEKVVELLSTTAVGSATDARYARGRMLSAEARLLLDEETRLSDRGAPSPRGTPSGQVSP